MGHALSLNNIILLAMGIKCPPCIKNRVTKTAAGGKWKLKVILKRQVYTRSKGKGKGKKIKREKGKSIYDSIYK